MEEEQVKEKKTRRRKTVCVRGHEYNNDSYQRPDGSRACRECQAIRDANRKS